MKVIRMHHLGTMICVPNSVPAHLGKYLHLLVMLEEGSGDKIIGVHLLDTTNISVQKFHVNPSSCWNSGWMNGPQGNMNAWTKFQGNPSNRLKSTFSVLWASYNTSDVFNNPLPHSSVCLWNLLWVYMDRKEISSSRTGLTQIHKRPSQSSEMVERCACVSLEYNGLQGS